MHALTITNYYGGRLRINYYGGEAQYWVMRGRNCPSKMAGFGEKCLCIQKANGLGVLGLQLDMQWGGYRGFKCEAKRTASLIIDVAAGQLA